MRPLRQNIIGFILLAATAAALFGVNRVGLELKRQAVESWLEKANMECERITDTSLGWLSLFHAQLRGVATLFYGSEVVTQKELLNALDLIEGVELEAMIPLTSVAYAERRSPDDAPENNVAPDGSFPVTLSSDAAGPLAVGKDLSAHPEIRSAILSAMGRPEMVIMGPVFLGENNQIFTSFAIEAINAGKPGILISVVNLSDFIIDLEILRIPDGLNLRIIERKGNPTGSGGKVIKGDSLPLAHTVATAYFPVQSGQAHWDYFWDVLPDYQGGPSTMLGAVVQYGGNALVLSVFFIVASLILQNARVNRLVAKRTEELVVATRAAEAANQAKSAFLSSMSHELRTPLNAILGYAQILNHQKNLTEKQRQQLDTMKSSGEHLLTLINDILDVGKIEAQQMEIIETDFDLPALLRQVFDIARLKGEEKDLCFQYETLSPLPEFVRGDERKLKQVLLNLLSNAVKYTPRGGVTLRVGYDDSARSGLLHCEVVDTGIGIPKDKLEDIFEPFVQLATDGQMREGTGLGLSITRKIVSLMHGRLGVESEPGKGSIFRVELTLPQASAVDIPAQEAEYPIIGYKGKRRRILIVDDNLTNISVLVSLLEPLGFEIRTADNGKEGIRQALDGSPDLILLDLVMPGMDGLEVAKGIREHRELHGTKILGVSATVSDSDRKKAFEDACEGFLGKPIRIKLLFDKMHALLGLEWEREAEGGTEATAPATVEEPIRIPPREELKELLDLIRMGDIRKIRAWAVSLGDKDGEYRSFAEKLRLLAEEYRIKDIQALVEQYVGKDQ